MTEELVLWLQIEDHCINYRFCITNWYDTHKDSTGSTVLLKKHYIKAHSEYHTHTHGHHSLDSVLDFGSSLMILTKLTGNMPV